MNIGIPVDINEDLAYFDTGGYIFMLKADSIPPHLGLLYNGKLYDLTVKGVNLGLDVRVLRKMIRKGKALVLFQLDIGNVDMVQIITNILLSYGCVDEQTSCLAPIKDFIEKVYGMEVVAYKYAFELLPYLHKSGKIKKTIAYNLSNKLINGTFVFKQYDQRMINARIEELKNRMK